VTRPRRTLARMSSAVAVQIKGFGYWSLARIDLTAEPIVAVGSICRRQSTQEAGDILTALHHAGLKRLHGFGFKLEGLRDHGHLLSSADSLAWSFQARVEALRLDGCAHAGPCNNCPANRTNQFIQPGECASLERAKRGQRHERAADRTLGFNRHLVVATLGRKQTVAGQDLCMLKSDDLRRLLRILVPWRRDRTNHRATRRCTRGCRRGRRASNT